MPHTPTELFCEYPPPRDLTLPTSLSPVPLKCNGFWILNLIETNLCGAKYGKEICHRILHYREIAP